MREKEYPPLLANGYKDITEADLYTEFVAPFSHGHKHRSDLLTNFTQFLSQFKELNLPAEIWIDGSFATSAPDPSDIDVVFYFKPKDVDSLEQEKKEKFERLFHSRKFMKSLYKVEVFYGTMGNANDYKHWNSVFGTCYDKTTPKGIVVMQYSQ